MIQKVRGTRDILPPESRLWVEVEAVAQRVFGGFGYQEIRLPLLEPTELFVRSVGEATDIVGKEMYTFADRKGRSLTLRPEGTASVARAFIENGLAQRPSPLRLSYLGPMFRYEKMQRGRYRQFAQIGIELLGAATPEADVEVVLALHTFLAELGFDDLVTVLNNLGDPEDRPRFIEQLLGELGPHRDELCADCRRRWEVNPLRILDCKVPRCRELVAGTTPVAEVVSEDARRHVDAVEAMLRELGVEVRRAPRLVRGLDYYLRTVFEVVSPELGEDTVICGGGRYDRLISDLGGPQVAGVGFAIGEDRLIEVLPEAFREQVMGRRPVAVLPLGGGAAAPALAIVRALAVRGIAAQAEVTGRSLKASLKWAAKLGARTVVIVGGDELAAGVVVVRDLDQGEQQAVPIAEVADRVQRMGGA
ncbi:MAG TPA: histidine--tRNA ligase [Thermoanaerobaculia bacterium]|nr:histidine--tRNA ligase [Thermoanaerobaculales bacterium]HQN96719.1 histidine--tRNA ligase [Thermoanaerobaculales bacterium]HQP93906.1 histidine--tRNA ligase [Thermoanaerobaculia bacterium]